MKKFKAVLMGICLLAMVGTQPAFAANQYFYFHFDSLHDPHASSYGTKSDNDPRWYLSLDNDGYNNMSASNIFGCKIHRKGYDNIDRYHTFSKYVRSYGMHYAYDTPSAGEDLFIKGQKDDASTSSADLTISGRFCP